MPKKLYLVDGSNQAFRAFFAIQNDMRSPDGFPTRALFGFTSMLKGRSASRPRRAPRVRGGAGLTGASPRGRERLNLTPAPGYPSSMAFPLVGS